MRTGSTLIALVLVFAPLASARAETLFVVDGGTGVISQVSAGGVVTPFATGFTNPAGLAIDAGGALYTGSPGGGSVHQITPAGAVSLFASGLPPNPLGMAFDGSGDLYVATVSTGVFKITPAGSVSLFASGMSYPQDVVFTPAGDLYVSGGFNPMSLYSVTASGTPTLFASVAASAAFTAIDVDSTGNFFVAASNGGIFKVTPGGTVSTFLTGYTAAGLAFDAVDNLYFSDTTGSIFRATPAGVVTTFATGFTTPRGLVFATVPEPSTMAVVLGSVVLGIGVLFRRRVPATRG